MLGNRFEFHHLGWQRACGENALEIHSAHLQIVQRLVVPFIRRAVAIAKIVIRHLAGMDHGRLPPEMRADDPGIFMRQAFSTYR